jgi:hypothetical protein
MLKMDEEENIFFGLFSIELSFVQSVVHGVEQGAWHTCDRICIHSQGIITAGGVHSVFDISLRINGGGAKVKFDLLAATG